MNAYHPFDSVLLWAPLDLDFKSTYLMLNQYKDVVWASRQVPFDARVYSRIELHREPAFVSKKGGIRVVGRS